MQVVYARDRPEVISRSMMLLGPSPRGETDPKWDWRRTEALPILEELGFNGQVVIPLPEAGPFVEEEDNYDAQPEWEIDYILKVNAKVMWMPRDLVVLPGFTSNVELGLCASLHGFVYGRPDGAPKTRYLDYVVRRFHKQRPHTTLRATLQEAISYLNRTRDD